MPIFFPAKRGVLIDSTALPSAINSSINAVGYADGKIQENVTCLMLVDQASKLPIYFRAIGGNISDVSALKTTIMEIKQLGLLTDRAILDAGFCSKANLALMGQEEINFITRLPKTHRIFNKLIKQAGNIDLSQNAISYGDRVLFIKSSQINLYGQELYAHIIFDPSKKSRDTHTILKNVLGDKLTPQKAEKLDEKLKNAGFFILLSAQPFERKDILPAYYLRQSIEQIFGLAKSNNNLLPLRVHNEESIRGYLMLVFIALILFVTIRQRVNQPMDKVLISLRTLKAKVFDNQEIIVQEPSKKIKDLFNVLKIIMPT